MKISQAAYLWLNYHLANSSENTIRAYKELLERFCQKNGDKDLKELTSDDLLDFPNPPPIRLVGKQGFNGV